MQKDSELLKNIRYEHRLTQQELAERLGVTKAYIGLVETEKSKLSQRLADKLSSIFGAIQKDSDVFIVKFYSDVLGSCGNGVFEQSQKFELITLPKVLINNRFSSKKEYSVVTARGDSMTGSIENGDKLIIESYNTGEQIIDNQIYIFCYKDELFIKRLVKNIDQIVVKSDNEEVPTRYIEGENLNNFYIQGRIVGIVRSYI